METDILLIEDDKALGSIIKDFLEREGYPVKWCTAGEQGLAYLEHAAVKLVLLDIMLPDIDGFTVCTRIRSRQNLPVIIISARSGDDDQITGLNLGADDYMGKPFSIGLLLAKIKSQLRRSYGNRAENPLLRDKDLVVDTASRTVCLKGAPLDITLKEYELLVLLLENAGKTLQKDWIFDKVWGVDCFSEPSTLTVHIGKLREKIEADPKNPRRIKTVWGVGYRYETL
ncbi:response regulator transcription factor [Eubacterium sp. 1001713B170207_170306_E7]|uniref:response regulator transcription factor n=1 Tax=Eubacterium sp. 1001713B170207_170306_E7 TaxID=2787097 RepID=UPI0018979B93|nr:response regulator transcription factor [Eubacterium sp. 1001713B170207_170306_E7]